MAQQQIWPRLKIGAIVTLVAIQLVFWFWERTTEFKALGYDLIKASTSALEGDNTTTTTTSLKEKKKKLVVFNALGKVNNLPLVAHARRRIFKADDNWNCVAFMFAKEDRIPDDNKHLRNLVDELGCSIPRTPGVFWGDFLQFLTPTFINNYEFISLVLDDMFIPHQGDYAVDVNKLLQKMQTHKLDVIAPGIVGESHGYLDRAQKQNKTNCLVEVNAIETYVQIFTAEAWTCFYSMLHYTGSRGWCYDLCFKKQCPNLTLAYDFSMRAWHMDRKMKGLPNNTMSSNVTMDLADWKPEPPITSEGYRDLPERIICERIGGCLGPGLAWKFQDSPIMCES
eukprot:CAMPEP_0183736968 /NCGR_PEP_ID=MMETSP0737-20130205/50722_1 /TAXON_ID=385413 /ORGANISM="Thalassiosira miniscula, Strain CCMP1093" /LENGTH=338 /DNA_ID=CAMNT_0025971131 /DNA_START=58 /DNA_END=1074 /DNA_ORIENTATION=-